MIKECVNVIFRVAKESSNAFVNEIWNWAKGHTFWLASLGYWYVLLRMKQR